MDLNRVKTLALWGIPALALLLGGGCCKQEDGSCSAPPESKSAVKKEVGDIQLRQAKSGSVLILEEPASDEKDSASDDDSLSGRPAKKLPAGYKAFRDQHIKFYVEDIPTGLDKVVEIAQASSGQVINHPIKGFENMGPNEKTLVFDSRTYPLFLEKLRSLGKVESPEIGPSDYITVRLTVLKEQKKEE
jgi:hypothetical protein